MLTMVIMQTSCDRDQAIPVTCSGPCIICSTDHAHHHGCDDKICNKIDSGMCLLLPITAQDTSCARHPIKFLFRHVFVVRSGRSCTLGVVLRGATARGAACSSGFGPAQRARSQLPGSHPSRKGRAKVIERMLGAPLGKVQGRRRVGERAATTAELKQLVDRVPKRDRRISGECARGVLCRRHTRLSSHSSRFACLSPCARSPKYMQCKPLSPTPQLLAPAFRTCHSPGHPESEDSDIRSSSLL